MSILRQMITDAVKDHTIVAYSKDVNDPIYQGREVDKIIEAIGPHDEMNVLNPQGRWIRWHGWLAAGPAKGQ
jgi:hypothetical protein